LSSEPVAGSRAVVFDLDGTLIDSRRDITKAINEMRAERGLAPLSVAEVAGMVGEGARMLVRRALPAAAGKEVQKQALASYLAHYATVCLETTRPFAGVAAMLAALAPSFSLGVLTNKGEELSRRILDGLGLARYLREVVGGDTLPTRKPNPGGLFLLADRFGTAPDRLLLVGDSDVDALTAGAGGCSFGLALWGAVPDVAPAPPRAAEAGGTGPGPASAAAPTWRFARPADVPAALGMPPEDLDV
jgi:phosphoglycolate phosphatase